MKIKLSKSKWNEIGRKAGWIKKNNSKRFTKAFGPPSNIVRISPEKLKEDISWVLDVLRLIDPIADIIDFDELKKIDNTAIEIKNGRTDNANNRIDKIVDIINNIYDNFSEEALDDMGLFCNELIKSGIDESMTEDLENLTFNIPKLKDIWQSINVNWKHYDVLQKLSIYDKSIKKLLTDIYRDYNNAHDKFTNLQSALSYFLRQMEKQMD